jgi:hypothetical protein
MFLLAFGYRVSMPLLLLAQHASTLLSDCRTMAHCWRVTELARIIFDLRSSALNAYELSQPGRFSHIVWGKIELVGVYVNRDLQISLCFTTVSAERLIRDIATAVVFRTSDCADAGDVPRHRH